MSKLWRHFIKHSTKKLISNQTKHFIDKLLLEKLSLAGITRVTGVSEKCLQDYVNTKYAQTPRQVFLNSKKGKIVIQGDEAWSFVGNNNNKPWIRLALDVNTKEIAGVYLGDRGELGPKDYGSLCRQFTNSVQFATRISGKLMPNFFLKRNIDLLENKLV